MPSILGALLTLLLLLALAPAAQAQARSVRVGVYQNKPKVFMQDDGRASGLFIEFVEEIARAEGWSLTFVPCQWSECLHALEDGRIDLMPDVAWSRERAQRYDFNATPVLESWSQLYARPSVPIRTLADLSGKRVALLQDSVQRAAFEAMTAGFGIKLTIVPKESLEAVFEATRGGTADVAIANHFFGDYFHRSYGLDRTSIVFQAAQLHYVTARGRSPELLYAIDKRLDDWRKEPSSPYYAILSRWMDRPPTSSVPSSVLWSLGIIVGMLLFAGGMILVLRGQVRTRTLHLERANEELRRAEAALRRSQESQKMEAIGRLAGGIAHDFNNLLTVIISFSEMSLRDSTDEDVRSQLAEVVRAGQSAAVLTRQLLAFSRHQVLELKPVDLNQTTREMQKLLRRLIQDDIELRLNLAPSVGPLLADPNQLEQVLMNLVLNARDSMPSGGAITIETAEVELDETQASQHAGARAGAYVMLSVADGGCGMDEQTRARIFEPFFTTKDRDKGTGLGLATVYGIVSQSGGFIQVDSEPGRGSTFKIYLPREQDTSADPRLEK